MLRNNALKQSQISRTDVLEFKIISGSSAEYYCEVGARELVEVCWNETIAGAPVYSYDYFYNNTDSMVVHYFEKRFLSKNKTYKLYLTHEKEHEIQYFVSRNANGNVNIGNNLSIQVTKAYLGDLCTETSFYFDCYNLTGGSNLKRLGRKGGKGETSTSSERGGFYSGNFRALINGCSIPPSVIEPNFDSSDRQLWSYPMAEGVNVSQSKEYQTFFANYADYDFLENKLNGELLTCNYDTTGITYQYVLKENKTFKQALFFAPYYYNMVGNAEEYQYDITMDSNLLLSIKSRKTSSQTATGTYKKTLYVGVKIIYTDGTFDTDYFRLKLENFATNSDPCLVRGTKITLYDGTTKNIEDVCYQDLLLVWNFETGAFDYQYPYFIKAAEKTDKIVRLKLSNGEYLDIAKWHEVYNVAKHRFFVVNYYELDKLEEEIKNFYVMRSKANTMIAEHSFDVVKVVGYEILNDVREYYTLLTGRTQTSFANNILVGSLDLNFLNIQPNNQWDNSLFREAEKNNLQLSYEDFCEEFGFIEKHLFYGAVYDYFIPGAKHLVQIEHDWQKGIKDAVENYWKNCKVHSKLEDGNGIIHDAWYCSFIIDNEIVKGGYVIAETEVIMPPLTDGVWYSVGHGKTFKPGEKVKIYFGNVFRKVKGE